MKYKTHHKSSDQITLNVQYIQRSHISRRSPCRGSPHPPCPPPLHLSCQKAFHTPSLVGTPPPGEVTWESITFTRTQSFIDNSYNIKYISSCFLDESWDCVKDSGKGKVLADAAVEHYWETIYYQHCRYSKSPYEKILRNSTKSQRYIWIRVGVDNFS